MCEKLHRFNACLREDLTLTIRAFCFRLKNVFRDGRIGTSDLIENIVEGDLSAFGVTVLAGFDERHRFAEGRGINDYDLLLFWSWIEGITRHGASPLQETQDERRVAVLGCRLTVPVSLQATGELLKPTSERNTGGR